MVLKDAYRYQNFLNGLLDKAKFYFSIPSFVTNTKQVHHRKKVNPDAEDEEIEGEKAVNVDFTPNDLIDFCVKAIDEKEKLSSAIATAKKNTEIDIDSSISMNKKKQEFVDELVCLSKKESREKKCYGKDYKFNNDGNQTEYIYEFDEIVTINFDRNNVRKLIKKYNSEIDETSAMLDKIQISTEVDFCPTWDVHDTLEDILSM